MQKGSKKLLLPHLAWQKTPLFSACPQYCVWGEASPHVSHHRVTYKDQDYDMGVAQ